MLLECVARKASCTHHSRGRASGADLGHGHDVDLILSANRDRGLRFPLHSSTPCGRHEVWAFRFPIVSIDFNYLRLGHICVLLIEFGFRIFDVFITQHNSLSRWLHDLASACCPPSAEAGSAQLYLQLYHPSSPAHCQPHPKPPPMRSQTPLRSGGSPTSTPAWASA